MKDKVHPTRTDGGTLSDYRETHPAYAQIAVSRVQHSGGAYLYGSTFKHRDYLILSIQTSELSRNLHRDHYFPRRELVRVALSEAQWATMISTLNNGTGTPCTIERNEAGDVPGIAAAPDTRKEFRDDLSRAFAEARQLLTNLGAKALDTRMPAKLRDEVISVIHQINNHIGSNLDFTMKTFGEFSETAVEKAKADISAYAQNELRRLGLEAAGRPPLELNDGNEKTEVDGG